jgi:hypothetical protein
MALRTMTLRERLQASIIREGMVNQLQFGNKSGITWVTGVRAAKLRYGRAWFKVILGQQSLRLSWGLSPAHVDNTGDD